MYKSWKTILLAVGILVVKQSCAQEENKPHQRLAFIFSHTHFDGLEANTNERKMIIAASIGLNYEYWFNKHLGVGLHNDLAMHGFIQENEETGKSLYRDNPFLVSVVAIYKPWDKWSFYSGPGKEFERNKNFMVIKTGAEFSLPMGKLFEVGFGAEYDSRINGGDSWLLGFSVGWLF